MEITRRFTIEIDSMGSRGVGRPSDQGTGRRRGRPESARKQVHPDAAGGRAGGDQVRKRQRRTSAGGGGASGRLKIGLAANWLAPLDSEKSGAFAQSGEKSSAASASWTSSLKRPCAATNAGSSEGWQGSTGSPP